MADPAKESTLPAPSAEAITALIASLGLPPPTGVEPLHVTAAFHAIYLVHFDSGTLPGEADLLPTNPPKSHGHGSTAVTATSPSPAEDSPTTTLVLRVSGLDVPHAKTANEVGVLAWLRANTGVPVPRVVRADATAGNPLGREFTLLGRVPGRSVDGMYGELREEAKRRLVVQLTDVLLELNAHAWQHVGGLRLSADETGVEPGPVLEDTFWMTADVDRYWPAGESVATLNPTGPYDSHTELVRAFLRVYMHAISIHESLAWLRDTLAPRLAALSTHLPEAQLNATRLLLAHKDLHFANVMATEDGTLTGVLDWEFAGIVPANRWDPVRAFLWNADSKDEQTSAKEKEKLRGWFEEELERRGEKKWWEEGLTKEAEDVWTVLRFTRALVEVCPRGQRAELVEGWRDNAMEALTRLGV